MNNFILKIPIYNLLYSTKFIYLLLNLNKQDLNLRNNKYFNVIKKEILLHKQYKFGATKTRSFINKSNKKLRPQKGLGKARIGSATSPICKGGSVVFGPFPKKLMININIKEILKIRQFLLYKKRSNIIFIKNSYLKYFDFNVYFSLLGVIRKNSLILSYIKNNNCLNSWYFLKYKYLVVLI